MQVRQYHWIDVDVYKAWVSEFVFSITSSSVNLYVQVMDEYEEQSEVAEKFKIKVWLLIRAWQKAKKVVHYYSNHFQKTIFMYFKLQ